eukprot:TRINITY_DN6346_c0_g3_i1.p1 TRINITY_DN6346_c0_g3~~TRINITY_DN6346_c0_g3_i1.p1  ORF type:complete len:826 (+),score=96.06 TRINITY_DN6346_c0_g3_i1:268-2745(+)
MNGRTQVLSYQKERIHALNEEQKRQIDHLNKLVASFDRKKEKFEHILSCVDKEWEALNQEVQAMSRAALPLHDDVMDFDPNSEKLCATIQDPFLTRLLQGAEEKEVKEVEEMVVDSEQQKAEIDLKQGEKMADTRIALTRVLDYICQQDLKRLNNKVKGFMNEDQREEFKKDTLGLQNRINGLQAMYRTAEDQVRNVENLLFESQQKNKELDVQLEETRSSLQAALGRINELDNVGENKPLDGETPSKKNGQNQQAKKGPPDLTDFIQAVVKEKAKEVESVNSRLQLQQQKLQERQKEFGETFDIKISKQFQLLQERMQQQLTEKEKIQGQISDMERDMVYIKNLENQHKLKMSECERVKQEIQRLRDVQCRIEDDLRMERKHEQDIQSNIRVLKTVVGNDRTRTHWKLMFQALEVQQQMTDYKIKQYEEQHSRVLNSEKGIASAKTFTEDLKVENQRAQSRARDRESRLCNIRSETCKLDEKVVELEHFVASLTSFKDDSSKSPQPKGDPDVQAQIKTIEERLKGTDNSTKLQQLDEREQVLLRDLKTAQQSCDVHRLEVCQVKKQMDSLQQQLHQSQNECSYYLNEIEVTGKGYCNMVTENKELQKYMEAKDEEISQLILEKQRVNQDKEQVSSQLKQLQSSIARYEQERVQQQEQWNNLYEVLRNQQNDFLQNQQQAQNLQQRVQENKLRQGQFSLLLESKGNVGQSLKVQSESRKRRLTDVKEDNGNIVKKRKTTEEENINMKRALMGDTSLPGVGRSTNDVFRQLKCSVCYSRQKSTILVRCLHTFCRECINTCLQTRQRRCPKCKTGFTNNEVKPFSLD